MRSTYPFSFDTYLVSLQIPYLILLLCVFLFFFLFFLFFLFWKERDKKRSEDTYLSLFLTDVGYRRQTKLISVGQSAKFWTTSKQGEYEPNHKWVYCNLPLSLWQHSLHYILYFTIHHNKIIYILYTHYK